MSSRANASPGSAGDDARRDRATALGMAAIALLFFLKTATLAFFVTPLWDVPDESGHVAYVLDLADGRGLPVYGRTPLPPEVLAHWSAEGAAVPPFNWVAQHPPVYHALAATFVLAARAVTGDEAIRLRSPRLLSVLAATLALIVLFRLLAEGTGDPSFALAAAGAVSFVPMYGHLASGTHNEPLLALGGALVGLAWVRLVRTGSFSDAMRAGAALAFAGGIKLTALPVAAALLTLLPRYLRAPSARAKAGRWLLVAAVALAVPVLWLARNRVTAGHPLVYAAPESFHPGRLARLLAVEPVADHTVKNFLGLIGWMGNGTLRWFQISGAYLAAYLFAALLAAGAAAAWLWKDVGSLRPAPRLFVRLLPIAAFTAALAPALRAPVHGAAKQLLYALLLAVPFFGAALLFERSDTSRELLRSAQGVILVFLAAYFWNLWRGHAIYGQFRAVHGRYFFAILPFLMLGVGYPAVRAWSPGPRRDAALAALVALLAVAETAFLVAKVIPFYRASTA